MTTTWTKIGELADFPLHHGTCVKVNGIQIAVFRLATEAQWYAVQNLNPQNQRMVLSRGITGDENGVPIVICPLHKYRFSLESGVCLTDSEYTLRCFPIYEEGGEVYLDV